ncbi:bifunctional hydroxymethylpyrimidine kinase/phosphomethylpyrimidine kinase [Guggenheimella bovis]
MQSLLTLAGFDPTGGAGITRDMAVFRDFDFYPVSLITALTVQDTSMVHKLYEVDEDYFSESLEVILSDISLKGMKIGLLTQKHLERVSALLRDTDLPSVVDPVLRSSSGYDFLTQNDHQSFTEILSHASVSTPNLIEAKCILSLDTSQEELLKRWYDRFQRPVVIKGGHSEGDLIDMCFDGKRIYKLSKERLPYDVHGTGCAFSSALLAGLAKDWSIEESFYQASQYMDKKIRTSIQVGGGRSVMV